MARLFVFGFLFCMFVFFVACKNKTIYLFDDVTSIINRMEQVGNTYSLNPDVERLFKLCNGADVKSEDEIISILENDRSLVNCKAGIIDATLFELAVWRKKYRVVDWMFENNVDLNLFFPLFSIARIKDSTVRNKYWNIIRFREKNFLFLLEKQNVFYHLIKSANLSLEELLIRKTELEKFGYNIPEYFGYWYKDIYEYKSILRLAAKYGSAETFGYFLTGRLNEIDDVDIHHRDIWYYIGSRRFSPDAKRKREILEEALKSGTE